MVFIMTHGDEGGQLHGLDGEAVVTKGIGTIFNGSALSPRYLSYKLVGEVKKIMEQKGNPRVLLLCFTKIETFLLVSNLSSTFRAIMLLKNKM